MTDYCAMCAAADVCRCYGSFDEDDDRCANSLKYLAERTRREYQHAWDSYMTDFYDDVVMERSEIYKQTVGMSEIHI